MIKVSYLVSYDYDMLLTSVKRLYDYVDKIVVAIDIDRKTWSGNTFHIPDSFFEEVKSFDKKNKIEFYFDTFYLPELLPMQNEVRERNMALSKLGNGWKIQLDVDEYIYDFKSLSEYLKKYWYLTLFPKLTPICLKAKWITLFREVPNGYLYVENEERFSCITNQNYNTYGRDNSNIRNLYTAVNVIHQSWARKEDEILTKIQNWGHRDDFDTMKFYEFWKNLNSENYSNFKNFHPLDPAVWDKLHFLKSDTIDQFIDEYSNKNKQVIIAMPVKKILKDAVKKIFGKL